MIRDLYHKFLNSTGVSTDTRSLEKGNIFFALKGPNFNANRLAEDALSQGASHAVIDETEFDTGERTILVKDVLTILQQLANHHRKQLNIPFIGITGSNGKTTTKELLHAVLSEKYNTLATRGNLNNHIGVPLTLLSITGDTEIAIIEMGANKIGDIAGLCRIAEPTHGLITNIGKAHTEGFGGYEGVLRGKTELYDWLRNHEGTVFINSNDPVLMNMAKRFREPVLYPNEEDFFHCELDQVYPFISVLNEDGRKINTRMIGAYNFSNIATALCVGKFFGVPMDKAARAVENYIPGNNRSQILQKGSNTFIMDAYNANPSSMEAALANLEMFEADHKMVILGDMYELGDFMEEEHRKIGKVTRGKGFDTIIFCGGRMRFAAEENPDALYFKTREELIEYLENHAFDNSVILVKGSRAMELEKVMDEI